MEDDWASPWADADDRSPTKVIKNFDVEGAEDAGEAGIDAPVTRVPNNNAAVHTNDPWGSGEHGFGDASAWASPSPAVRSGEIPEVVGPGLLEWVETAPTEVSSFVVEKTTEEEIKLPAVIEDAAQQQDGTHGTSILPVATDEADVWAAGSDWGGAKTETEEPSDRELPSETTAEIKPLFEFDTLIGGADAEGSVHVEEIRGNQFINTEILDHKTEESGTETEKEGGSIAPETVLTEGVPVPETIPIDNQTTTQESGERAETIGLGAKPGEEDDDFGDFADEGDFEEAEEGFSKDITAIVEETPPLPPTPALKVDTSFNIDTSLLSKLYPIPTSYPEPPPIGEIICTTESRKAWYRLSQSGTIRKDKSGDDDYVRVTWGGSKVQEDVNKIVARWVAEDRNSGGGVALGGSRRLGAMFGWGEGIGSAEKKVAPIQLNLAKDSHPPGNISVLGSREISEQPGALRSPLVIPTTTTHVAETGISSSPQVATFGWSSLDNSQSMVESHSSSSSTPVKGEDKPPTTPYRASFYGTPSRMSSQAVTPSKSASHSPIGSSHSSKLPHSLAATRPSSPSPQGIPGPMKGTEITPIAPTLMDGSFSATPTVSKLVERSAPAPMPEPMTTSVLSPNFDEWGTFENMATTVKLPSTTEANCNFEEWVEDLAEANPKSSRTVSMQNQTPTPSEHFKTSKTEEPEISLNKDNWGALEVLLPTPKTRTSDTSPEKSAAHTPTEPEQNPSSGGQNTDNLDSMAFFAGPLVSKPSLSEELSVQPSAHGPIASELKSVGSASSEVQKADAWSSFDAFENSLAPKPLVSTLSITRVPADLNLRSLEVAGPKVQGTGNWGSFEAFEPALTPSPTIPNQLLGKPPTYNPQAKSGSIEKHVPKAQNIDDWGSFGASDAPQSKETSNLHLSTPVILNGTGSTHTTSPIPPPIQSSSAVNDDDDDWGEMVQSPEIPNTGGPFSTVLQPTTSSQNNAIHRAISPAPLQSTQPQTQTLKPNIASTASMFDFSNPEKLPAPQKSDNTIPSNNGGSDTWDLSFFDGPVPSTTTPVNASAQPSTNRVSQDLWDAPPPVVTSRRENAKEMEENSVVNQIVEGLPDLSYMLS